MCGRCNGSRLRLLVRFGVLQHCDDARMRKDFISDFTGSEEVFRIAHLDGRNHLVNTAFVLLAAEQSQG